VGPTICSDKLFSIDGTAIRLAIGGGVERRQVILAKALILVTMVRVFCLWVLVCQKIYFCSGIWFSIRFSIT